eukprot:GHRQ01001555.1.p2 GENE.GHRQ01001555.1~~GHRQ01001555.1.p2  ORF type:complete len:105 (+),score=12.42 GHRQ01001555.1:579-893(+)
MGGTEKSMLGCAPAQHSKKCWLIRKAEDQSAAPASWLVRMYHNGDDDEVVQRSHLALVSAPNVHMYVSPAEMPGVGEQGVEHARRSRAYVHEQQQRQAVCVPRW